MVNLAISVLYYWVSIVEKFGKGALGTLLSNDVSALVRLVAHIIVLHYFVDQKTFVKSSGKVKKPKKSKN